MTDAEVKLIEQFFELYSSLIPGDRGLIIEHLMWMNKTCEIAERTDFYFTEEWQRARYFTLKTSNGRCQCCGQRPTPDNPLHVDHIKPRSKFPGLALSADNLQVLCAACNYGKSNIDQTDWRT